MKNILSKDLLERFVLRTRSIGTSMMRDMSRVPPHIGVAQCLSMLLGRFLSDQPTEVSCSAWNPHYGVYMSSPTLINFQRTSSSVIFDPVLL